MSVKKKYLTFSALSIVLFLYVCLSTVYDRWTGVIERSSELSEKESSILESATVEQRSTTLLQQREALLSQIAESSREYEQNQTGLFEYLSQAAAERRFRYQSLEPSAEISANGLTELEFKASFQTDYLTAGKWLKSIESGAIPVRIRSLEISTENTLVSRLNVAVYGKAHLFSGLQK